MKDESKKYCWVLRLSFVLILATASAEQIHSASDARSFASMAETGYDAALIQFPDVREAFEQHIYLVSAGFFVFQLIMSFALCQTLLYFANRNKHLTNQFSQVQIYKMVTWLMECLAGLNFLVLMIIFVDPSLLFGDSYFRGHRTGQIDDDWSVQVGWIDVLTDFLVFYGWGILPFIAIYFIEIYQLGQMEIQKLLVAHHLVVIVLLYFGFKAFFSTLNPLWLQTCLYMFLHVGLEFPIWGALITYRLRWRQADLAMFLATVFELISRVLVWFGSTLVYVELCWRSTTYTKWEQVWRWAYLVVFLMQAITQGLVLKIHWAIYKKARNSKISSRQSYRASKMALTDKGSCGEGDSSSHSYRSALEEIESLSGNEIADGGARCEIKDSLDVGSVGLAGSGGSDANSVSGQQNLTVSIVDSVVVHQRGDAVDVSTQVSDPPVTPSTAVAEIEMKGTDNMGCRVPSTDLPLAHSDSTHNNGTFRNNGNERAPMDRSQSFVHSKKNVSALTPVLYVAAVSISAVILANSATLSVSEDGAVVEVPSGQRIAIVGGGIAGLGAAWALKQSKPSNRFHVTVFESSSWLGGAALTYYGTSANGSEELEYQDFAFAAFRDYYNFELLLSTLGVETIQTTGTFSAIYEDEIDNANATASTAGGVLCSALPREFATRNRITRYLPEINRLDNKIREALDVMDEYQLMTTTLESFLAPPAGFSQDLVFNYLSFCLQAYVAVGASALDLPLALFIAFEGRFRLCTSASRVSARLVGNGASMYVDSLRNELQRDRFGNEVDIKLNTQVDAVRVGDDSILGSKTQKLRLTNGEDTVWEEFDHVIFTAKRFELRQIFEHADSNPCSTHHRGTSSDICMQLYRNVFGTSDPEEVVSREGDFAETIVHNDTDGASALLEPFLDSNGCYNFNGYNFVQLNSSTAQTFSEHGKRRVSTDLYADDPQMCRKTLTSTHIVKHPVASETDFLEEIGISHDSVLDRRRWWHSSHNVRFFQKGRGAHVLQGLGKMWFAGADFVMNFHEEAFVSGLVVAHKLGAGFAFKDSAPALTQFLRIRSWMLYGLNFLIPPATKRGRTKEVESSM